MPNKEYRMLNVEVYRHFGLHHSLIDIRHSLFLFFLADPDLYLPFFNNKTDPDFLMVRPARSVISAIKVYVPSGIRLPL
jgi:hypothetical protein